MIKIFISHPMGDKTKDEIISEREQFVHEANCIFGKDNYIILDPLEHEDLLHISNPLWDLGRSIQLLSKADAVIFVADWEYDKNCKIEHMCATLYDKEIYYISKRISKLFKKGK